MERKQAAEKAEKIQSQGSLAHKAQIPFIKSFKRIEKKAWQKEYRGKKGGFCKNNEGGV